MFIQADLLEPISMIFSIHLFPLVFFELAQVEKSISYSLFPHGLSNSQTWSWNAFFAMWEKEDRRGL